MTAGISITKGIVMTTVGTTTTETEIITTKVVVVVATTEIGKMKKKIVDLLALTTNSL